MFAYFMDVIHKRSEKVAAMTVGYTYQIAKTLRDPGIRGRLTELGMAGEDEMQRYTEGAKAAFLALILPLLLDDPQTPRIERVFWKYADDTGLGQLLDEFMLHAADREAFGSFAWGEWLVAFALDHAAGTLFSHAEAVETSTKLILGLLSSFCEIEKKFGKPYLLKGAPTDWRVAAQAFSKSYT